MTLQAGLTEAVLPIVACRPPESLTVTPIESILSCVCRNSKFLEAKLLRWFGLRIREGSGLVPQLNVARTSGSVTFRRYL